MSTSCTALSTPHISPLPHPLHPPSASLLLLHLLPQLLLLLLLPMLHLLLPLQSLEALPKQLPSHPLWLLLPLVVLPLSSLPLLLLLLTVRRVQAALLRLNPVVSLQLLLPPSLHLTVGATLNPWLTLLVQRSRLAARRVGLIQHANRLIFLVSLVQLLLLTQLLLLLPLLLPLLLLVGLVLLPLFLPA